jgi:acetoin utilization deacetylase AcuC-like enzyme
MAITPVFLEHPSSLEHDTGAHYEQAARIVAVLDELERRDWLGWSRARSPEVALDVLGLAHSPAYIESIKRAAAQGGGWLDADTVVSTGSYVAALHAVGGAVEMVERLVADGEGARGFSAHRPPGHHALAERAMGFCLFNNIAVASRFALERLGLERVLVLDWDVHHGNGTEEMFIQSPELLFVSIHQWPFWPGSGAASDIGAGPGRGFNLNLPVPAGSGDDVYVSLVRDVVVPLAREFSPQLILISAGYDAHVLDPLADCRATEAGFAAMAALMSGVADELGVALGCVLEGGYSLQALPLCVASTMEAVVSGRPGASAAIRAFDSEPVGLAVEALSRLAEFWPGLVER